MNHTTKLLASTVLAMGMTAPAFAQDVPASADDDVLKIGLVYTLSGPPAALGVQARDGFMLAAEKIGDIGGMKTEIIVIDDEGKPDLAAEKARELVARDNVDFVVGPIFSNILMAMVQPVTSTGTILISTNAGTSTLAGEACNPNFFTTSSDATSIGYVGF